MPDHPQTPFPAVTPPERERDSRAFKSLRLTPSTRPSTRKRRLGGGTGRPSAVHQTRSIRSLPELVVSFTTTPSLGPSASWRRGREVRDREAGSLLEENAPFWRIPCDPGKFFSCGGVESPIAMVASFIVSYIPFL